MDAGSCFTICQKAATDAFAVNVDFVGGDAFTAPVDVTIALYQTGKGEETTAAAAATTTQVSAVAAAGGATQTVDVPLFDNAGDVDVNDGSYTLEITCASGSTVWKETSSTVTVKTLSQLGYITTDKPIYKPGHTVKARAFAVSTGE